METKVLGKSLQVHSLPGSCARELFKPSKDLASLLVCNETNFRFVFFVGDIIIREGLGLFGQSHRAQVPCKLEDSPRLLRV